MFIHKAYDPTDDAENPDDWLSNKLRALQTRRHHFGIGDQKRKNEERILLEELKNVTASDQQQRGRGATRTGTDDPLEDYRREASKWILFYFNSVNKNK